MTRETKWSVEPDVGILPIKFGMTESEVSEASGLGRAKDTIVEDDGLVTHFWGLGDPNVAYRDGKVVFIATGPASIPVLIGDVEVFQDDTRTALQAFEKANGDKPFHQLGSVNFTHLNLAMTGFFDFREDRYYDPMSGEQDDRVISLFAPGTMIEFPDIPKTEITFF